MSQQKLQEAYKTIFDNPFPGTNIPSFKKMEEEFGNKIGRAIYYRHLFGRENRQYRIHRNRTYANNNQDPHQYKSRIDPTYNSSQQNTVWDKESLVKISWRIFSPAKKVVNAVVGMIAESQTGVSVNSLDHSSKSEREALRTRLIIDLHLKDILREEKVVSEMLMSEHAKKLIGRDGSITSTEDVEVYINIDHKMRKEIGMEMLIDHNLRINKYREITERRIMRDIVVNYEYCAKLYFDQNNRIKIDYGDIANYVGPQTTHPTNEFTEYDGFYQLMSILEVRNHLINNGDYKSRRDIELVLFKLAKAAKGLNGNPNQFDYNFERDWEDSPWDDYRVETLYFHYYTIDTDIYRFKYREDGDVFVDYDTKRTAKQEVPTGLKHEYHKDEDYAVYEGLYIHQLGKTLAWGKQKNICRPISGKSWGVRPVKRIIYGQPGIHYGENSSLVDDIIEPLDMIQEHSLHIRKIIANHMPGLTYFDYDSLVAVAKLVAKNGVEPSIKDILKVAQSRGIALGLNRDMNGQPQRIPYNTLPSNLQNDLNPHVEGIIRNLNFIREITGVNESADGSVKNDNALVGVQKLQRIAAVQLLSDIFHAYSQMAFKSIAEALRDMIQTQLYYGLCEDEYKEVLGEKLYEEMRYEADKPFPLLGIHVESLPSKEQLAKLQDFLEVGLKSQTILPEDVADISSLGNVKKTIQKLKYRSRKRREQEMNDKLAVMQQEGEENRKSAEQAAEIHKNRVNEEADAKIRVIDREHKNQMERLELQLMLQGANKLREVDREGMHDKDKIRLAADMDDDRDGGTNQYAKRPDTFPVPPKKQAAPRVPSGQ